MALLIILMLITLVFVVARKSKRRVVSKETERQKQADELITVILPTINSDH